MKLKRYSLGVGLATLVAAQAPAAFAYQAAAVADGGVIAGKVVYNGTVQMRTIVPTKDQEVCGQPRQEPEVAVGPDKGVGHAFVYLENVASGKDWPAQDKLPVIDNKDCRFVPDIQVIRAGNVTVVNSDPILHNTKAFYGRRSAFNMALPNQGQRIEGELPRPGMVRVECDAHGWMLGWVFVADNPYYAMTAPDGTFELKDVPPGNYTLVVHQPFLPPVNTAVTVKSKETAQQTIELKK